MQHAEHDAAVGNTNGAAAKSDAIENLLKEVREVLDERGIPADVAARTLESLRADAGEVVERTKLNRRWRRAALNHGVKAAAEAAGVSRFSFLKVLADLEDNPGVWRTLAVNLYRIDELDALAAEPRR